VISIMAASRPTGAIEFLTKPFADDVLLQAIQRGIARSREALGQAAELKRLRERYASLTCHERDVMARPSLVSPTKKWLPNWAEVRLRSRLIAAK